MQTNTAVERLHKRLLAKQNAAMLEEYEAYYKSQNYVLAAQAALFLHATLDVTAPLCKRIERFLDAAQEQTFAIQSTFLRELKDAVLQELFVEIPDNPANEATGLSSMPRSIRITLLRDLYKDIDSLLKNGRI